MENPLAKVTDPGTVGDTPLELPVIGKFEESLEWIAKECKERGGGAVFLMSVPTSKRIAVKQIVEISQVPSTVAAMVASLEELLARLKDME